jgi:hypothetical protein
VLDTFVRALPHTYRHTAAPPGTHVRLTITGPAGNTWSVIRDPAASRVGQATPPAPDIPQAQAKGSHAPPPASAWALYTAVETPPAASVTLDQQTAWRLFTRGIDPSTSRNRATIDGDVALGEVALRTVSIIA